MRTPEPGKGDAQSAKHGADGAPSPGRNSTIVDNPMNDRTAVISTVVATGGLLLTVMVALHNGTARQIEELRISTNRRIDALNATVNRRIDDLNTNVNSRIDDLGARVDDLAMRVDELADRVRKIESDLQEIQRLLLESPLEQPADLSQ